MDNSPTFHVLILLIPEHIPMDPWRLSEKVRLTLQIFVNYTPVGPSPTSFQKVRLDP